MKNTTSAAHIAQLSQLFQDAVCAEQRAALRASTYLNQLMALRDAGEITQQTLMQVTREAHVKVTQVEESYREGMVA